MEPQNTQNTSKLYEKEMNRLAEIFQNLKISDDANEMEQLAEAFNRLKISDEMDELAEKLDQMNLHDNDMV
jgi:uncharacterized membrane protein YgaE (UPF0421/DUF939 family)